MALQTLSYTSNQWLPIAAGCCGEVVLCITEAALEKLADPTIPFVYATAQNSGRYLGSGGMPYAPRFEVVRCEGEYQYTFQVDDTQLAEGETLDCGDIASVTTDVCLAQFAAGIESAAIFNWTTAEQLYASTSVLGSALYAKSFTVAAYPNATSANIAHGVTGLLSVYQLYGVASNGTIHLISDGNAASSFIVSVNGVNIVVTTTADLSLYSGRIYMIYTKSA